MAIRTLDEVSLADRTVGIRIDVNSPLRNDGSIADDFRFRAHRETLDELTDSGARVAVLAHQGRPGGEEFSTLEAHAEHLDGMVSAPVTYCDATFSSAARAAIRSLEPGEIVCLENVRFYSEEYMSFEPAAAGQTHLVDGLAPLFDLFVNDAFSVAHRDQPSVIGFPERVPSVGGRIMARELAVLGELEDTPTPRVALLAGAKVTDSLAVAETLLREGTVASVLAGGVLANLFFLAGESDPGEATRDDVADRGYLDELERAHALLEAHGDQIVLPLDVAVPRNGERVELDVESFPPRAGEVPRDIGRDTIADWEGRLASAGTVICNGPVGRFEDERFTRGTERIFAGVGEAEYAIAGGGDTGAAIRQFGIDAFDHVSTGGGAALALLSGETLPGVRALEECTIEPPT